MPELPEVETIVQGLRPQLINQRLAHVSVFDARILKGGKHAFMAALAGKTVASIKRHGKAIFWVFNEPPALRIHLGMTGQLLFRAPSTLPDPYTHVVFSFENLPFELHYRDIRKFGEMELLPINRMQFKAPDAWTSSQDEIFSVLRKKKGMIKHALLNQHVIAGLGNIYVDESLYRAKIHPKKDLGSLSLKKLNALCDAIRAVLKQSIEVGGTSFRNYVDTRGGRGGFKSRLSVYGKTGLPCSCGALIRRIMVASRGTHFCPRCQR